MRIFHAVLRKELVDNARDRRALSTALLITPLMGPLMLLLSFSLMSDMIETARAPKLPVVGSENAPELVQHLAHHGVTIVPPPADAEQAVRDQEHDAVLVIPADFNEAIRAGRPAVVELVADSTRTRAGATAGRIEELVRGYGGQIGALRLVLRGVDPSIAQAVAVERREVASPQAEGAFLLGVLPLMLLMACFLGGMYVAIDATAGERERGSLEPLLYQPIRPFEVMAAKMVATSVFSFAACVVSVGAFALVIPAIPLENLGVSVHLDLTLSLRLLSLLVPLILVGSASLLVIGTLSKTFRTAQAAISVVVIVPMLPGLVTTMFPQKASLPLVAFPALGESLLAMQLVRGEPIELSHQLALAAADLGLAGVLLMVAARMFGPRLLND
jgi:sodium transport system permease protein